MNSSNSANQRTEQNGVIKKGKSHELSHKKRNMLIIQQKDPVGNEEQKKRLPQESEQLNRLNQGLPRSIID